MLVRPPERVPTNLPTDLSICPNFHPAIHPPIGPIAPSLTVLFTSVRLLQVTRVYITQCTSKRNMHFNIFCLIRKYFRAKLMKPNFLLYRLLFVWIYYTITIIYFINDLLLKDRFCLRFTFVEYNLNNSHRRHVCNCWYASHSSQILFVYVQDAFHMTSSDNKRETWSEDIWTEEGSKGRRLE
jgi:hypothetical protein